MKILYSSVFLFLVILGRNNSRTLAVNTLIGSPLFVSKQPILYAFFHNPQIIASFASNKK